MSSKGEVEIVEPTAAERAHARRVAEARATVPDLELGVVVEMSAALALASEAQVSITVVLLRACALALAEHPRANGAYRDGRFELYSSVNIALALERSSPVILDAAETSLAELHGEIEQLTQRAERGELRPPELSGATFTFADLGALGVDRPSIVITPPQAAAVAAGTVRAVPTVSNGAIVPGHEMVLALSADGRILNGTQAGAFIASVKQLLEVSRL
ncbi:MAG TPA: 2-oxo acid dehydrogenase subunit E2 [Solirubrobacteraceae bacterium]|nr:2-oxo acid dehydrogenase subunit E2 [Solirubrobacteraceae bacterium]